MLPGIPVAVRLLDGDTALGLRILLTHNAAQHLLHIINQRVLQRHARLVAGDRIAYLKA